MSDTMRIKMYVAGELAYDNFLPEEEGLGVHAISIEEEVNKGGVATVTLPKEHPCRDKFSPYSVPVEIYRNGKLRWRGRPIPPAKEDMYLRKSVLCEGELCFLQDALHRPYAYEGSASHVFSRVIGVYNAAVEPWKRFAVGDVEIVGNVTISSNEPENVLETVQTLIEQYGGHILFTSGEDGIRKINWYSDMPYTCNQTVRYGDNLTGYSSQTASSDFATRIVPYGKAGEDGKRIQIDNAGKDYVENADAVAAHGIVERAVIYKDVTDPAELQTMAQRDVDIAGLVPAVIQLSAIDLSRQDISLEAFSIGQQVPAESAAHGLSGFYYLKGLSEDLVNPGVGKITLVREQASLNVGSVVTLTGAIDVTRKGLLSAASLLASSAVSGQTQEFIFNKLTNNGALKGLYMLDGELYVSASYIKSGAMDAALLKTGILTSTDGSVTIDLNNNKVSVNTNIEGFKGRVDISSEGLFLYGFDYTTGEYVQSLKFKPGSKSDSENILASIINYFVGLSIYSKEEILIQSLKNVLLYGALVQIGLPSGETTVLIHGKETSWKSNADGTFTLIGK